MENILSGDYIAGFVDGEGCFALKFRRDIRHKRKNKPVYFYWDIEFAISLRKDDKNLLEKIKNTLKCGRISVSKNQVRYAVNHIEELSNIIVPFFNKYKLYGKKRLDFQLWENAVKIFIKNQQIKKRNNIKKERGKYFKTNWNIKDVKILKEIHNLMTNYKSKRNKWKWL